MEVRTQGEGGQKSGTEERELGREIHRKGEEEQRDVEGGRRA